MAESRGQFARRHGLTTTAVTKAIRTGRIILGADGNLPDDADEQYKRNTDENLRRKGPAKSATPQPTEAPSFLSVKIRKETAAAQLKEIELAKEKGQLLEKEQVKESVYKYARQIRDAVLSIPERVAADLAAQLGAAYSSGKKPSDAELERIVRNSWQKESRAVLAAIEKTPDVKNKKRKTETEET